MSSSKVIQLFNFISSRDVVYAWGRSKYSIMTVNHLKKILQPHRNHSYYHVTCEEHGTGKTTLVRIASNEVGCGVIYVDIPTDSNQLGKAFGKAINSHLRKFLILNKYWKNQIDKPKISELEKALEAFNHASEVYKAKHDKPMVIVYDNISHLVYKNPDILDILQDDAKHSADDRKYIAIFVSNEGSVPRRMQFIKQKILTKVEDKLRTAKLLEKQDHYDVGKCVIKTLSNPKELKQRNTVTFQSRAVECYIQENANIFQ
ncbi:hypothetical protein C1645_824489 [Glomus cerebriforme]|uniref:P-loop containing nucleoside triphosphate hydrolase protein n=1 Tax=Glomus cerebriforme TaxID=658196 RepID=A0A397SXD5_9GLOM|nr:hypothetical protein C1645_824489 [Glomus cerebriforme]